MLEPKRSYGEVDWEAEEYYGRESPPYADGESYQA